MLLGLHNIPDQPSYHVIQHDHLHLLLPFGNILWSTEVRALLDTETTDP